MTFWTPERIDQLQAARARGLSFARCAMVVGCTRNAALAKWARLNGYDMHDSREQKGKAPRTDLWTEEKLTERWADRHRG